MANDDPPRRYTGQTVIGQAFESQWDNMNHAKASMTFIEPKEEDTLSSGTEVATLDAEDENGTVTPPFSAKRARTDTGLYEAEEPGLGGMAKAFAKGDGYATPSEDDLPKEVQVTSDSESIDSDTDVETMLLEDAAFSSLLQEAISRSESRKLTKEWDKGLSPKPLYSFYHQQTRCRHWSFESYKPISFLCQVAPNLNYSRGGDLHMDIRAGICRNCIKKAGSCSEWSTYMANQVVAQSNGNVESL